MARRSIVKVGICCVFFLCGSTAGQSFSSWQSLPGVADSVKFTGWGAVEMGQVVRGNYNDKNGSPSLMLHRWIQRLTTRVGAVAKVNERLRFTLGVDFAYQFNTAFPAYSSFLFEGPTTFRTCFWLDKICIEYQILNGNAPILLQFGFFPFKYNDAVTNLGAYLFRTECYPTCIYNYFDFTDGRLLGLNLESSLFGIVRQNLLFTSEAERYPVEDFSLSYLLSASLFNKAVDIGAGIYAHRLFPVDKDRTTPRNIRGMSTTRVISKIVNGDTTFYTFSGTRLMARATFDIKALLPYDKFGKEDLRLYCEGAILGVRNFDIYDTVNMYPRYDILSERSVVMVGLHLPVFGFLDVLAIEAEYFPSRYYGNSDFVAMEQLPLPTNPGTERDTTNAHRLKWSVYCSKKLGKNLRIVFQAARDHSRVANSADDPKVIYYGDNFVNPREWYYIGKVMFGF